MDRKDYFKSLKRIVVKVGSSTLTQDQGLNISAICSISKQISSLMEKKIEVIIVSSGAMASGIKKLGFIKKPDEIPKRQAVAAVGQPGLMLEYEKAFLQYNKKVAQILLTGDDLINRTRYLNSRNTICTLLSWGVVPIINENDTVAIEEIKFGDNDNLSALITLLLDADLLINLTDIDGMYNMDPRKFHDAELIHEVSNISQFENAAGDTHGILGTGGMLSKINAAKKVIIAGIPMVIAKGSKPDILEKILSGNREGTFFIPEKRTLHSRQIWIAFNLKPKGSIIIDEGAARALIQRGTSLLASGIVKVEGDFGVYDRVECKKTDNQVVGIGLVNYSSSEINKIKGLKSCQIGDCLGYKNCDEVIHRDNLVVTLKAWEK
ncbi:MAG: glutamate 5-kinase [Desulfobacterales bacterium]|nr:glutamate 5-kinase [Desulfobacterales bacterium]MBF0395357.1 glutamate 5-kinase [Desulfobacterales bacterium]